MKIFKTLSIFLVIVTFACDKEEVSPSGEAFFDEFDHRKFRMGFTSWSYGPLLDDVHATYNFLSNNGDIYTEHIDNQIPWSAWINDDPLPQFFVDEINFRVSNQLSNKDLLLSVSLLNLSRSDLAEDFDGQTPSYTQIDDLEIVEAYRKHVQYLVDQLEPTYLVIAIESNELLLHSSEKWEQYQALISSVTQDIKSSNPSLKISESMTLHNLFSPDVSDVSTYQNEVINHINSLEFAAISFYPFFKGMGSSADFQQAFDFLNQRINVPIAFVETAHLAEDLVVPSLQLNIPGSPEEQNEYLEVLMQNAQQNDYEFIIWWAHRDFERLWETFPEEVKDIGQIWRDTGLIDENGNDRKGIETWNTVYSKPYE